jgi:hypothetical protein
MRLLIALDLNDDDLADAYISEERRGRVLRVPGNPKTAEEASIALAGSNWDDLCASLDARFDEFYCGPHNETVRGRLLAAADFSGDAMHELLSAADIGADGIEPEDARAHVIGSLTTFRQHFEAQEGAQGAKTCSRCGKVIIYDAGDLAWRADGREGLICLQGDDEDGANDLGHVPSKED